MDPVYGYEAVNVEAQQSDRVLAAALDAQHDRAAKALQSVGRGTLEFLHPENRKVLAYLRRYRRRSGPLRRESLSIRAAVELDLSALAGMTPVEMLGYVEFPAVGRQPYPLTLGPYGFFWFELQRPRHSTEVETGHTLYAEAGWTTLFEGSEREKMEHQVLPAFLPAQRWFGGKSRSILAAAVVDWAELDGARSALTVLEIRYIDGGTESYFLPLVMTSETASELTANTILARVVGPGGAATLRDGTSDDATCAALLALIDQGGELAMRHGHVRASRGLAYSEARGGFDGPLLPFRDAADQSNTSIRFGDRLMLKLFRRQQPGPNPDCEISRYLTEQGRFLHLPMFAGSIEYQRKGADAATLAMLQGLVSNQGDGWTWTLAALERYYEACAAEPFPEAGVLAPESLLALANEVDSPLAREHVGLYLDAAATLGRRTAELHAALGAGTDDPGFAPELLTAGDLARLAAELRAHAEGVLDRLKERLSQLPDEAVERAGWALARRRQLLNRFAALDGGSTSGGSRIRVHGDYHLGQVLRAMNDFVILDFEGEPARTLAERRAKHSPLKDVAGMLRSFSYAAGAGLLAYTARRPDDPIRLDSWARLWERATAAAFLRAYRQTAGPIALLPADESTFQSLLDAFLLDKTLYELEYELNNRPAWVSIPLRGILSLRA